MPLRLLLKVGMACVWEARKLKRWQALAAAPQPLVAICAAQALPANAWSCPEPDGALQGDQKGIGLQSGGTIERALSTR